MLRLLPLLLFAAQSAFGCEVRSLELRKVSPDLTVVVTHHGKPIPEIKVQVVPKKSIEPVFTAITDGHGTVHIRGLIVGQYYLTASHEDFEAGKEWIEVVAVPDAKTQKRLDFQWADWSYETSRVAGTLTGLIPGNTGNKLMDIVHPVTTFYSGVDMTLTEAFSKEEFQTISDSFGGFIFGELPDGIYVLTIAGGMKSITGIADVTRQVIDVKRLSKRDSLPLELKDTGCYRTEFELSEK
jgi:hypothetical protein